MRWHTRDQAAPDEDGRFVVRGERAKVTAMVTRVDEDEVTLERKEQVYEPPHDKGRLGCELEARRESYVEASLHGDRCRLLTLFCVESAEAPDTQWSHDGETWRSGEARVAITKDGLEVSSGAGARRLSL